MRMHELVDTGNDITICDPCQSRELKCLPLQRTIPILVGPDGQAILPWQQKNPDAHLGAVGGE